ncbi:MAG: hypothetical protein LQ348_000109 [Seirophora lacunosa]|nr:MAG: hypothetical protein LQ344_002720 [Seirophora lacunosa]KAI4208632.1 MAG: hypothetical protein LQ348_000109 [Seirophora lacunosa]
MAPGIPTPPTGVVDDLFDYDVDMQEVFRNANVAIDVSTLEPRGLLNSKNADPGLGIDEEIKVTKKRQPIPKLDDNRLLSQAGIPKLRRIAKERFKFKGKGHEYSDLASLLNVYQFWLDDLYPRAKFADGLAIIEKLGHSKKIQVMRRTWINEEKPQGKVDCEDAFRDDQRVIKAREEEGKHSATASENKTLGGHNLDIGYPIHEDLYGASPPQRRDSISHQPMIESRNIPASTHDGNHGDMAEDDLDALLAETYTGNNKFVSAEAASRSPEATLLSRDEDDFDAELEVMAQMED